MRTAKKPGPALSHDPYDKMMAALLWWQAWDKKEPDYIKAPHYFDAIMKWHEQLSEDQQDLCLTVYNVCVGPRNGGQPVAERYAADLPPVSKYPDILKSSG